MAVVDLSDEQGSPFKAQESRRPRGLTRFHKAHSALQWAIIAAAFVFLAALVVGIVP